MGGIGVSPFSFHRAFSESQPYCEGDSEPQRAGGVLKPLTMLKGGGLKFNSRSQLESVVADRAFFTEALPEQNAYPF
jgi:hypothetical protein